MEDNDDLCHAGIEVCSLFLIGRFVGICDPSFKYGVAHTGATWILVDLFVIIFARGIHGLSLTLYPWMGKHNLSQPHVAKESVLHKYTDLIGIYPKTPECGDLLFSF